MNLCALTRKTISLSAMLLVITACGGGGNSGDSLDHQTGTVQIADLESGQCMTPVIDSSYVSDVEVKSCSEGVKYQVAGHVTLSDPYGTPYPGHVELSKRIYNGCEPVFEAFTGLTFWSLNNGLDIETVAPSISGWESGDREAICLIRRSDGNNIMASVEARK